MLPYCHIKYKITTRKYKKFNVILSNKLNFMQQMLQEKYKKILTNLKITKKNDIRVDKTL